MCRAAPGPSIDERKELREQAAGGKDNIIYLEMKLHLYNHALYSGQLPILDRQEHWVASGLAVPDVAVTLL